MTDRGLCLGLRLWSEPHADLVNTPALRLEHLDFQPVEIEDFADRRHAPDAREQVAAHGFESFRFDLDAKPIANLGDVSVEVRIDSRELIVLVLSANIRLQPDYLWDPVATEVRARLFEKFGFRKRALGQPALLCEIVACIQNVEGVAYVDVDAFGGVPEKKTDQDGTRRLLTLDEISQTITDIVSNATTTSTPAQAVTTGIATIENGTLIAAQLAMFTSSVPDTTVLNQIK